MIHNFDTYDSGRAKAALVLYALYRSRSAQSPLTGKDTWNRCDAYIASAVLKSTNMPEFVQQFCRLTKIDSIKPGYTTEEAVKIAPETLVQTDGIKDYKPDIYQDDSLLPIFERESKLIILLVRERIQREKNDIVSTLKDTHETILALDGMEENEDED